MRRWLAVVVTVGVVAVGAFAATAWIAGGEDEGPAASVTTAPPPLKRLTVIFQEGFTVAEMADRVEVRLEDSMRDPETVKGVADKLARLDAVDSIGLDADLVARLGAARRVVAAVGFFFGGLLAAPIGWFVLRKRATPQFWRGRWFAAPFFTGAVLFGVMHIMNYPHPGLLVLPMVLPQLWAAFTLGYIRMRIGLPASILAHATSNALALALAFAGA